MENKKTNIIKYFVVLHFLLFFNSFTGVCLKFAAQETIPPLNEILSRLKAFEFPFSGRLVLLLGCVVLILGIYAIVWQQVLKYIPLTTAICNKAVSVVVWGSIWGCLIFKETLKWNTIVGAVIVIIGVILVVTSDEH